MTYPRLSLLFVALVLASGWLSVASLSGGYAVAIYPFSAPDEQRARDARLANELALRVQPVNADGWFRRAVFLGPDICLFSQNLCDAKIQSLSRAVEVRPFWAAAWAHLAQSYLRNGEPAPAITALRRAMHFGPYDNRVHAAVAEVGLRQWEALAEADREAVMHGLSTAYRFNGRALAQMASFAGRSELLGELIPEPRLLGWLRREDASRRR